MTSVIFSAKEAFLELISRWPTPHDLSSEYFQLVPVGFLSLFTEDQRKLIASKLKFITPMALHLARKNKLDLAKLTSEQQKLAYDCFPEDQLDLIQNQLIKNWVKICSDTRKDLKYGKCGNSGHIFLEQPWEWVVEIYHSLLDRFDISYQIMRLPKYCFWNCLGDKDQLDKSLKDMYLS